MQALEVRPVLTYSPHPLLPVKDRRAIYSAFLPGESLADYIARAGIDAAHRPHVLHLNDSPVPRELWSLTFPRAGDLITLRAALAGGGGRNNDRNKSIRTIATIAVLLYSQNYTGAAKVAIAAAGTAAAYALFPPDYQLTDASQSDSESSPTYSISGGSNRARRFQPLPLVLGQHRIFPDLGAQTYTEFEGDDQYLYQVFNFGLSELTLSDYKIGDTPITDYAGYEMEESGSDGALDLFPANVDSAAGAGLDQAAGYVTRTSSADATALAVDIVGYLYYSGQDGIESRDVTISIEYRAVGSGTWLKFLDANSDQNVTISHSSRQPLRRMFRRTVTQGQYEVRLSRVTPDETDDRATSQIEWSTLRTYQPDTASYEGQKRVALRIKATNQLNGQIQAFNATASASVPVWNGATWVTQATSNPAWLGLWLARGKYHPTSGARMFGAGLPDSKIDLEAWKAFGAWCDTKSLTCNLIFDRAMNCDQMLTTVVRCGRGRLSWASGKLGVIWDEGNQPEVARFGMANIRKGSFKVEYVTDTPPSEVVVRFVNPALNYQQDSVRATVPSGTDPAKVHEVDLMGCTDADMAGREANLMAAEFNYRYRRISWETDMEGSVADRGDVVGLSHDLTQWGYSGRLLSASASQLALDRAVPFSAGYDHYIGVRYPDGSYYINKVQYVAGEAATLDLATLLVKADWQASAAYSAGDEVGATVYNGYYYVADAGGTTGATEPTWPTTEGDTVVDGSVTWRNAGAAPEFAPDNDPDGYGPIDYVWMFEPKATPGRKVKIVNVKPVSERYLQFTAVDEDENYYLAEFNSYTHVSASANVDTPTLDKLEVTDSLINVGNSYAVRLIITWDVSGEYGGAIVRAAPNGEPLQVKDHTFERRAEIIWPTYYGNVDIEVTAFNKRGQYGNGGTASATYTIVGKDRPPADVTNPQIELRNTGYWLTWDDVNEADLLDYLVREYASVNDWNTASAVARVDANEVKLGWLASGDHNYLIKARDSATPRNLSTTPAAASITIAGPAMPSVTASFEAGDLVLKWDQPASDNPINEYIVAYGDTYGTAVEAGRVDARRFRIKAQWVGAETWWVTPVDEAANVGSPGSVGVTVNAPVVSGLTRKVIDNQAVLTWSAAAGTLPIQEYRIYKGDTFGSAVFLGSVTANIFNQVELTGGTYTYWVEPTDVADNTGTAISTVAFVNDPPDFVLREDWYSDFSGTKTNIFTTQANTLLLPVNTTETWADHFVNNGWSSPQDQIDAGYSYYSIPSLTSAVYEETFDYGQVLEGTLITVTKNLRIITGAVSATVTISYKKLSGDAWYDEPAGTESVFATNFQYVKVKIEFAASGADDLAELQQLNVRLSVKQITDEGNATANAGDSGGTTIALNKTFVAVESLVVTPDGDGTAKIFCLASRPNTANPTDFPVWCWDRDTGNRVTTAFSWTARGN